MEPPADLLEAALAVRAKAHAPYSKFLVGAAVRTAGGGVYAGCNVENASFPEGSCAETGALSNMVAAGGRQTVAEVLVVGSGSAALAPCGGCRQRLMEFGQGGTAVWMVAGDGQTARMAKLGDLLPSAFTDFRG